MKTKWVKGLTDPFMRKGKPYWTCHRHRNHCPLAWHQCLHNIFTRDQLLSVNWRLPKPLKFFCLSGTMVKFENNAHITKRYDRSFRPLLPWFAVKLEKKSHLIHNKYSQSLPPPLYQRYSLKDGWTASNPPTTLHPFNSRYIDTTVVVTLAHNEVLAAASFP